MIYALEALATALIMFEIGLSKLQKPLLMIPAAVPMMVINAGRSTIALPFLGAVDLGLFYPLLLVPVGIVGAGNAFNMLAG